MVETAKNTLDEVKIDNIWKENEDLDKSKNNSEIIKKEAEWIFFDGLKQWDFGFQKFLAFIKTNSSERNFKKLVAQFKLFVFKERKVTFERVLNVIDENQNQINRKSKPNSEKYKLILIQIVKNMVQKAENKLRGIGK
ncbi:MAG: hypothetical protein ACTSWY_13840 [Promethearchaeota archaeon]